MKKYVEGWGFEFCVTVRKIGEDTGKLVEES